MEADRTRWDERYAEHDLAEPVAPEALEGRPDLAARIPSFGRALDVACGTGSTTLWLAERGLDVTALDVSPRAIDLAARAAAVAGRVNRVDARVHDLDDGLPSDTGTFDVVVCQRFRDRRLYRALVDALAPGGIGIVTVLSAVGTEQPGEFHAPADELSRAFAVDEVEMLLDREGDGVASVVFRKV